MLLNEISIRNTIFPGDLGYIIHLHGKLYQEEYQYGTGFEMYVAKGICEFYANYNEAKDRIWIAEHNEKIIGTLFLVHKENNSAQLRYFLISPGYRSIGLGKKLMQLFIQFLTDAKYTSAFLWTTNDLPAAAALYKKYGFILNEEIPSTSFGKAVVEQKYVRD